MPLDLSPSPAALRALNAVDEATRVVADTHVRLGDLAAQAARVAVDADWHAPSARAFHESLERWRTLLVNAQARADDVADALARARAEIQARAWMEPR